MSTARFFEAPEPQSIIKTLLVEKYFRAWARVVLPWATELDGRILYIDLFSGPGKYEDGSFSTPLHLLSQVIADATLCNRVATIFNDKKPEHAAQLEKAINALPDIERLTHKPRVWNDEVGHQIVDLLRSASLVPTLFFIDPWGYKGLSLDLIGQAIKNWGCDCIFFFNYNRINPGLNNERVREYMNDLFGSARVDQLRAKVARRSPDQRQTLIIDELTEALGVVGGKFVLPFEFESEHGKRPSHYVVFVSKEFRGYHIMKEVMAKLSSDDGEVKRFHYVSMKSPQMSLFADLGRIHSIAALRELLAVTCAGKTQQVIRIYQDNTVGTPYTLKNIKDAIITLESEGKVTVDIPAAKRIRRGVVTLGDKRWVSFLPR